MCKPDRIHWCDGSPEEYQAMLRLLVLTGTAIPLDEAKRPNSYLVRSDPADVARVEDRTFICSRTQEEAGPTNNWEDPAKMKQKLTGLFTASMTGRTMYVVPYSWVRSARRSRRLEWRLPTRPTSWSACTSCPGWEATCWTRLGGRRVCSRTAFDRRAAGAQSAGLDLALQSKEQNTSAIFRKRARSGRSAPATAATHCWRKKCHALRIASVQARDEGWMAEHMLILKLTSPSGRPSILPARFLRLAARPTCR